ncbi:Upc2 protein [Podospora didyma]|uniref:Upc2 protein n=1 Tax=Podospora didyma TaxID=330526 RepID=A0AAE0N1T0_9PEZI|nr:Upc2 protein [Podospora didyma]
MRRAHKKSRYGCRDCKLRRIKCDETRPTCVNCSSTSRRCSYLDSTATLPSPSPSTSSILQHSSPPVSISIESPPSIPGDVSPEIEPMLSAPPPPRSRYSLFHLQMLRHFQHNLTLVLRSSQQGAELMLKLAVEEAFSCPFLMDEIMALSCAHMSTTYASESDDAIFYRTEATRLQSRGVVQFTAAQANISEDNCLALFFYSAFLGHHVLFDTFSPHTHYSNLAAMLDKFVQCLGLHRGIRTIAGTSWETIEAQIHARLGGAASPFSTAQLRPPEPHMFDASRTRNTGVAIQDWPVRVPRTYIDLLNQRQPEALVILAYYAVLLNRARDYWAVGGAGKFLIHSITDHLGAYWAEWLAWPNQMLLQDQEAVTGTRPPGRV